jgi:hypothetical protein
MDRRPGSSDFALFGQLTQLACFDPTSMALALLHAPRVLAWVDVLEDLSGSLVQDDQWCGAEVSAAQRALLCEVGNFYAPFLLANGAALARGEARVECEIDGRGLPLSGQVRHLLARSLRGARSRGSEARRCESCWNGL